MQDSGLQDDGAAARGSGGEGLLAVCATPIGNRGDITQRVAEMLESADVVYAEDTRVTRKLLEMLGISAEVRRCDENVTAKVAPRIVEEVAAGLTVALVSDAGMPCISDPGQRVVAAVREAGLTATVLPGASAVATAVAGSGFVCTSFYFGGFFPRKAGERQRLLASLGQLDSLLVFYESNHRTVGTLRAIAELLPGRRVCMARELTKMHEEYLVTMPGEMADALEARPGELRGEVVLVIEQPGAAGACTGGTSAGAGADAGAAAADRDVAMRAFAATLVGEEGMTASRIAKRIQREFGISRDEAYELARCARRDLQG